MMETETAPETVTTGTLKITCERDELASGLTVVTRAVSARSTVQVLAGVRLAASEEQLELAATDMELSLRATVDAEIDGDGIAVVPGKLLVDLVRLLPQGRVTLEHREGILVVSAPAYESRVNTYAADDFPRLPSREASLTSLDTKSFLSTIDRVARAASRDESRPVLTGILVRFEGQTLIMAATDSYRLCVKETTLSQPGPELEAIIPARALAELQRLAVGTETVELGVHENHVVFHAAGSWLTTRRIDGQFPNVKQLLPDTFEAEVSLPRSELLDAVRRAAVMAQRNTPLRLRFAEGELVVSAQSQDIGETRETLPIGYTGDPLEIGFNADFLREGLESLASEAVTMKLINPLRPGLITAEGDAFWYLIMPIRLAG